MKYSHPLAYVAAFVWPVLAAAVSFGQMATTQPGVAPDVFPPPQSPPPLAAPAAPPAAAEARIAVLPFAATDPQAANAWIGKSIQQSLSADLLQTAPSRVQTADNAVNAGADAAAVGRQLGVNYVVFGSYSSTDSALRIVGQVVDCSTGNAISSLKATGKIGDVFVLEDAVSRQARTAIFGQSASDNAPAYTVHQVPDNGAGQTYYPPNGAATPPDSSTGYANAVTPDYSQQYQQAYVAQPSTTVYYSYPYYSYPSYYSYPYYYGYPGIYFGFGYYGGRYYGGGHYYSGGGFHGGGGGGFHGGGGGGFHGGGGGGHR